MIALNILRIPNALHIPNVLHMSNVMNLLGILDTPNTPSTLNALNLLKITNVLNVLVATTAVENATVDHDPPRHSPPPPHQTYQEMGEGQAVSRTRLPIKAFPSV